MAEVIAEQEDCVRDLRQMAELLKEREGAGYYLTLLERLVAASQDMALKSWEEVWRRALGSYVNSEREKTASLEECVEAAVTEREYTSETGYLYWNEIASALSETASEIEGAKNEEWRRILGGLLGQQVRWLDGLDYERAMGPDM
jgi:hypothetical protein